MIAPMLSPPAMRLGPRPLPLHLMLSLSASMSLPNGLIVSAQSWMKLINPELHALANQLAHQSPTAIAPVLLNIGQKRISDFLSGVERYHFYPYSRQLEEPPVVWSEGSSRVLDYGGDGPIVFFVPSLINRSYILDISQERSMLRWLATQGLHPVLLDWGQPGAKEHKYGLTNYVARLHRALDAVGEKVHLVGYCMGGNLALAAARDTELRSLTLMATPWDFHAGNQPAAKRCAALFRLWQPSCQSVGELPVDLLQSLFALLDPLGTQNKFTRFAEMTNQHDVENFVALEDWLNDGIPLVLKTAEECLLGWYDQNCTAALQWEIGGSIVDPAHIHVPTMVITPAQDKIVPPVSAEALAMALPECTRRRVPLGHVGMIVSRQAETLVWHPLAEWLKRG